jgi:hypothetical protein
VVLTVFDRDTLAPLSVLDEQGRPAAPELTLGQVTLAPPGEPAGVPEGERLDVVLGDLELLQAAFDRQNGAPGDPVYLTLMWQAAAVSSGTPASLELALVDAAGEPAAAFDLPVGAPWYPPARWAPGDAWRGQHVVRLPASLPGGDYGWQLALAPGGEPVELPQVFHVTAPERSFEPPPVDVPLNVSLGDVATLVGAGLAGEGVESGTALTVTLVWRAEATPLDSYHVFLHLRGRDGGLVAQSDGIPAGWGRPTTGWLPGEYVTDVHVLALPDGWEAGGILVAGLYLPGGERLRAPDGADGVTILDLVEGLP